ncbi:hypothetical protein IMSAG013_00749 [Clostridiales bacterium]|nr:V-type ATP synthase subunit I [Clostridiales bacterium]GFI55698.1 hypothetical protein IMSAG013_00749 [Clostridiales bacterium]
MAVAQMKKLSVVALRKDAPRLIADLQKLRCVEVSGDASADAELEGTSLVPADVSGDMGNLLAQIASARRAIEFLTAYETGRHGLFDPPMEASIDDFDSGLDTIVLDEVKAANILAAQIADLEGKIIQAEGEYNAYLPWIGQDVALPADKTAHTRSLCGTLPVNLDMAVVEEKLSGLACTAQAVYADKSIRAVLLIAHREDFEAARKILGTVGFAVCPVQAAEEDGYASGAAAKCMQRLERFRMDLEQLKKTAKETAAAQLRDIKALYDMLITRQDRLQARSRTCETEKTVLIHGWVPVRAGEGTKALLEKYGAAYSFEDPGAEDDVPVLLSNRQPAKNFESVLSMYALPQYGRFDPTAIMAVFYTIIFGLMFADVGYGAIMVIGCLAGLHFLYLKESMRQFLKMFAICGVSCIIGGILFGGYFGDLPNAIMEGFGGKENTPTLAVWFDMVDEPIMMLLLSLGVGAVHMVTAFIIKFVILIRDGHIFDAIADVGSWLILFAGIGVYFLQPTAGLILAGLGVLMLICTQGRHEKNIIMKLLKGIMSLYDIVGYVSDLLSYSRILALSLASAVIASVMNLLSTMGGFTVGGIILFVVVFLLGHVINFLVNILGTYVHTSRLQYIEFFGKFYESGGREFAPLEPKSKYVQFK